MVRTMASVAVVLVAAGCTGTMMVEREWPRSDAGPGCPGCTDDGGVTAPGDDAAVVPPPPGTDGGPVPPGTDAGPPSPPDAGVIPTCDGEGTPGPLSFTRIPDDTDFVAPGRGAEAWHERTDVDVPAEGRAVAPLDNYHRFTWSQLERSAGVYDWSTFDRILNESIDNRQKLSFGIMSACPGCPEDYSGLVNVDGALAAYPADVHRAMQGESVRDWISDGYWAPNWNSPTYLRRYEDMLEALADHLETGSSGGVRYRDAIAHIDVRGYGSWGEWHVAGIADTVASQPSGVPATPETLMRIVDMHVSALHAYSLVLMIAAFDGERFNNMGSTAEVAAHALSQRTDTGPLGWRRDNWGALDDYIHWLLELNPASHGGVDLSDEIMNRWRTSPVTGEPPYYRVGGSCDYDDLETQVRRYHATSFGNGNYGGAESSACMRDNVRRSARAAGYRIVLEGGSAEATMRAGATTTLSLDWHNVGLTPTYETWNVEYELQGSGGDVVWSGRSAFRPRLFLPAGDSTRASDDVVIPESVPAGDYDLVVVVRDPTGFRAPLPLAIEGRRGDGSYLLRRVSVVPCP